MTNLCGHDRDVLRWALELWATVTNGGMVVYSAGTGGAKVAKANAFGDANDPAKLAEMLAARGRELGFFVGIAVDMYCRGPIFGARSTSADSIKVWVRPVADDPSRPFDREFTMPQARAILLQWLQLPDGAREEAERALRGET